MYENCIKKYETFGEDACSDDGWVSGDILCQIACVEVFRGRIDE